MWEREYHNEGNIETGKLCKITLIIFLISTMMIIKLNILYGILLIIMTTTLSFDDMMSTMVEAMEIATTNTMIVTTLSSPNTTCWLASCQKSAVETNIWASKDFQMSKK